MKNIQYKMKNKASYIDDYVHQNANLLAQYGSFTKEIGWMNGKMGVAVFLYKYARIFSNENIRLYAEEIVNEVMDEINENISLSIEKGISGIAISVMYLLKNNYIQEEDNDILVEIDNFITANIFANIDLKADDYFLGLYFFHRHGVIIESPKVKAQIQKMVDLLESELQTLLKGVYNIDPKMIHSILLFLILGANNGIDRNRIQAIVNLLTPAIYSVFKFPLLNIEKLMIEQFLSYIHHNIIPIEMQGISEILSSPKEETHFLLSDFINLSLSKFIYAELIDINWENLIKNELDESVCPSDILAQFIENLSLNNMSLNYYATGLSWTILDTKY
ncbi:hypothetical protein FACS189432_08300 [Bacteroidia bacterium]|nr:hypothetical protein FACS189432_08300 [Bacteroidia bacterium]GHV70178.1 hypothetical protein FACS189420_0200 [Bacteroidia bacterium]